MASRAPAYALPARRGHAAHPPRASGIWPVFGRSPWCHFVGLDTDCGKAM